MNLQFDVNDLLDEIKVRMHNNGYEIEDIRDVVSSINEFFNYVRRNDLANEFLSNIDSFRNNILRRIDSKKSVSNILSVSEFNGTSPASRFIKGCIEKRVQSILNDFLRSSEVYYNMACNNEGVDVALILAQLSLDGLEDDKSVELTAPATIMSFSTELSLKTLYSVKNYDAIVRNIYSEVTKCINGNYPNEKIFNDRLKLIEYVSGDWKNIAMSNSAQNVMNMVRDSYSLADRPVNLPDDDRFGNVKVNGHTLYKVFDNLPEEITSMIKYQIATSFSREDKKSLDEKVVSAIDYFLMITELDTNISNMDSTKQMVINSNNFDRMRYLIDQLGSEELLFSMAFASSSYIIAKNEVEGISYSTIKNCDYSSKGLKYTDELDKLVSNNPDKKYLIDYIVNNRQLLSTVKNLNCKDLYVLIDMFSLDEINWMKESCEVSDSCSFREMLYYCIFFKRHLNSYEFKYSGDKYKNINKLFYTIKNTNNLAMLGSQLSQWFSEINIYSLSEEEFEALKIFDSQYIYNSLSYKDRVLYKKCTDIGVPFKIYYTSYAYSNVIYKHFNSDELNNDNFEEQISSEVNRNFNQLLLISDEKFNLLKENASVYELLCREFGSKENIPHFLLGLPLSDIEIIVNYCKENGESLKDWSQKLLTSNCFFCKTSHIIKKVNDCYKKVNVNVFGSQFLANVNGLPSVENYLYDNQEVIYLPKFFEIKKFLESNLFDQFMTVDISVEKDTDKDLIDYLLSNGIDYLSAIYLQKNCSKEHLELLMHYFSKRAIPNELLGMIVAGRVNIKDLLEKNEFFVKEGCRLDDIPLSYYIRNDVNIEKFKRLFTILDGIYKKENIPNILLNEDTNKVEILINKLKKEKVDIHRFISNMSVDASMMFTNLDDCLFAYNTMKNMVVTSGMIIKDFDMVISDYERFKKFIGVSEQDSALLKASLYQTFEEMVFIKQLCDENNLLFVPELLYFDKKFLNDNLDYVYIIVDGMKKMQINVEYENALTLMKKMGWTTRSIDIEENNRRKVA